MRASRFARACAATAVLLGTAACANAPAPDDADLAAPPDRPAEAASDQASEPAPEFSGVQHRIPSGTALRNDPELYQHVALTGCDPTADGWRAVGTAHNPGSGELTFDVLVFFTDAQARIVDSATTTVTVSAGSTTTWTARRRFETTPGTACVVRAVSRGD
ncbi:hypothetical protein [Nocardioides sp. Root190]|uniref:hypothetical protein n=1 Tax=Nocardioides sp. Root190 TaxID=1736488 RepID=UPI0012FCB415|nr:hypothetical protein [Nocardioides sp. Root190]